jgi:8-oxo-dGTP pyrophosphatase MutT (NUDIX family)
MFTAYRRLYIRLVADSPVTPVQIRPAATIVVAHDGRDGVEVLMVRRSHKAVFMGSAHVFPGGAVDEVDSSPLAREAVAWSGVPEEFCWRAAALRELFEEAGVLVGADEAIDQQLEGAEFYEAVVASGQQLDADALEYIGNWVTPLGPPRRFDARFFVAAAAGDPVTDDREVFDAVWVKPTEALKAADRGDWQLEFPTRVMLEMLASHANTVDLMAAAAAVEVIRMAPRVEVSSDGSFRVLLPGDPGFEEAPA